MNSDRRLWRRRLNWWRWALLGALVGAAALIDVEVDGPETEAAP